MNDIFETDGALRAEFSEIENKKLNKIKADAVREAMRDISNSLNWDWPHVSSYEYCELLNEYADKIEKGV